MVKTEKKILITDKVHEVLLAELNRAGFEVEYLPEILYAEIQRIAGNYEGIVINSKVIGDRNFLFNNRHLKFIARLGSGLDIIDLEVAHSLDIDGTLSGACLDVLENEKLESLTLHQQIIYKDLFKRDNVLLSPHVAGWTEYSLIGIADILASKILNFYKR